MNKKLVEHINEFYVDQAMGPALAMSEEEIGNLIKSCEYNIELIRKIPFLNKKDLKRCAEGMEMFVTSLSFRMLNINRAINRCKNENNNN